MKTGNIAPLGDEDADSLDDGIGIGPARAWIIAVAIAVYLMAAATLIAIAAAVLSPARARDAPAGWSYPFSCCSQIVQK